MIEIKEISAVQTYAVRLEVLRKGIDLPVHFVGDTAKNTFHLGVFEDNVLVTVASFMKTTNLLFSKEQYQLRGMATLPASRGKGYGKKLLVEAIMLLENKQLEVLWCNARETALTFYLKLDFQIKGEPFEIKNIGKHFLLYKVLNQKIQPTF
ncbi:MAG: GNAT family N-acetyltransferase [Flavobacteriaceae bacterium]|nr:GNAT family N-acetyltransferase [Flavobacteriaceae bacterium]